MTDWRPIKCPYCRSWHEQPDAAASKALCMLESVTVPPLETEWGYVHCPLNPADFPELSEKT